MISNILDRILNKLKIDRSKALGAVVGMTLGFFILGLFVLMFRGLAFILFALSLGTLIYFPLRSFARMGMALSLFIDGTRVKMIYLVIMAAILWPLAAMSPFLYTYYRFTTILPSQLPSFPGSRHLETRFYWGDFFNHPDQVTITYAASADSLAIADLLDTKLAEQGFANGPSHFIEWRWHDTRFWYQRKGRLGGISTINIRFRQLPNSSETEYSINYRD